MLIKILIYICMIFLYIAILIERRYPEHLFFSFLLVCTRFFLYSDQTPLSAVPALGLHCLPTSKNWTLDLYWLGNWIIINPCS